MQIIENQDTFSRRFAAWSPNENLSGYSFVENVHAPFTPVRRALPMMNLALISSAGAYINGTDCFDTTSKDGDLNYREFPIELESADMLYAAVGYDSKAVTDDRNSQIPIDRLVAYSENGVLGSLNSVWWSLSSHIPNAARVADELAPAMAERLHRYEVQAALLIPASRLCHQTLGIIARVIEDSGIPTMCLSVDPSMTDKVRPPRTAYYNGEFGSVAGKPNYPEYQLRVLDEALRWTETFDQPGSRKLAVDLETETEAARGER
ncbi:MAG TPA: glycine/sarcosine/betaine reductase selenoprotein B family protein [Pyrinomonadaceae bacterium]|nr:glycine/sarcosine/betaine reductase selenoprotein B family protein [Pyrinomonadaceae bacterium]